MKVRCEHCQAGYEVADAQVGARGVRFRCRRCSHDVVVRPGSPQAVDGSLALALQPDERPVLWHVSVDGEQRGAFPEAAIIHMVRQGELTPRAHVWTEGMPGWRRLTDVAPFRDEITPHPLPRIQQQPPPLPALFDDVPDAPGVQAPRESTAILVGLQRRAQVRRMVLGLAGVIGTGVIAAAFVSLIPTSEPVPAPPPVEKPAPAPVVTTEDAPRPEVEALGQKRAPKTSRKPKSAPPPPIVVLEQRPEPVGPERARIRLAPVEVSSSGAPPRARNPLSDEMLARVYTRHRHEVSSCIQHASTERQPSGITLRIKALIESDGTVRSAEVTGEGAVARCVKRAVLTWRFPAFDGEPFEYAFSVGG